MDAILNELSWISIILFLILIFKDTGHGVKIEIQEFKMKYTHEQQKTREEIKNLSKQIKELANVLRDKK